MGGADLVEAFVHDVMREFGAIAFAAQVGEVKMAQFGGHDLRGGFGGGLVGKMAMPSENALLEAPRSADAILQHLYVVIGFEHEHIRRADALDDQLRHVAEVGDEGDVAGGRAQQITNGILGVVRNGERIHEQVTDFKARAGLEQPAIEFCFELEFKRFLRGAVAINRDVQFGGNTGEALNVVAVLMRDQDGGEIFRHPADGGEALADLARGEPGVHEHAGLAGLDVGAIAGGTAAENGEFDGHAWTLVSREDAGNFFRRGEFDFERYLSINYPAKSYCFHLNVEHALLFKACANQNKDCDRRILAVTDCPLIQNCALC